MNMFLSWYKIENNISVNVWVPVYSWITKLTLGTTGIILLLIAILIFCNIIKIPN